MNKFSFSQRMGHKPKTRDIQTKSMDEDLRNRLWNTSKFHIWDEIEDYEQRNRTKVIPQITDLIWHDFFKRSVESKPNYPIIEIRNKFLSSFEWNEVYDFLELLFQIDFHFLDHESFGNALNIVLQEEFSAYRVNNGIFVPITNPIELEEIEEVSIMIANFPQYHSVGVHMTSSIEKLSNKQNPDYRNSIKESISAVEALCRELTSENTLGKALSRLESKGVHINGEFKKGLEKLYGYTNSKDSGIRHAIIGNHIEPGFEEAKFMLVSCSAFINYLIGISS